MCPLRLIPKLSLEDDRKFAINMHFDKDKSTYLLLKILVKNYFFYFKNVNISYSKLTKEIAHRTNKKSNFCLPFPFLPTNGSLLITLLIHWA